MSITLLDQSKFFPIYSFRKLDKGNARSVQPSPQYTPNVNAKLRHKK